MVTEDLTRFRYHTGAPVTIVAPDEECPVLFRDIGFEAMRRFLRGELRQLCGPLSPVTYMRTAAYREPYVDHGRTGRIMLLQPLRVGPWHAGIAAVYVAPRSTPIDPDTMAFLPAEIPMTVAAERFASARRSCDLADAIQPSLYKAMMADTLERLNELQRTHRETERLAAPLRKRFQSPDECDRDLAAAWMERAGVSESDLCTAWHHLPDDRRAFIAAALQSLPEVLS